MQRHLDEELKKLETKILEMGKIIEEMIELSINTLVERTDNYTDKIYDNEKQINKLHIEIDDMAFKLLALMQPVATDMRFIVMVSKINSELERIGDQSVNILQDALHTIKQPLIRPLDDFPLMTDLAQKMVRESLEAFVNRDTELAKSVLLEDKKIDAFKDTIFRELLTYMISQPSIINTAMSLILIIRNLERIGDLATNIAEEVIYMTEGREVRHHFEKSENENPEY